MAATDLLDDWATAACWAVEDEVAASYAEAQRSILASVQTVSARLNEQEAVVHAGFFDQYEQWLFCQYGDRRNGGEGLGPWGSRHVCEMLSSSWNGWHSRS
ncbi:hypothetical protein K3G63_22005 [Hymenobacter sp. HSC-4F20]|uniref:hypothetical protein n=1 Tax=Hymenobacter sp. HSC-4F20 TaxID=2864135 RepID=UPI001C7338FB|nr:hypothetical protein [Hymenobacter sp. HSC-4F20]MBX0293135.1 hypothetical protein [Hymenobacter sp. HSC-4F20]